VRIRRLLVALLLLGGMAGTVAVAAEPEDHFTDPCDAVESAAADDGATVTTPWTDICRGRFEVLDDATPTLRVTLEVAGEIDDRAGLYTAQWEQGDCQYRLTHDRGLGTVASNGILVSDPGGTWLRVRCGEPVEQPCPPVSVGATCLEYPDTRHLALEDAVAVVGTQVVWTLRFDGDLEELAGFLEPGSTLTRTVLQAATKVGLAVAWPSACVGDQCLEIGNDRVRGSDFTVPERAA
jgi:hypothetical protein